MTINKTEQSEAVGWFSTFMANRCENCILCKYARERPDTAWSRMMHLHGKWCPFWKAHKKIYGEKVKTSAC